MSEANPTKDQIDELTGLYLSRIDEFEFFRQQVAGFFQTSRHFQEKPLSLVHSVKSRVKDVDHLAEKIRRKWSDGPITRDNLFQKITDFAGVRVLHLHTQQFRKIHMALIKHIDDGFWTLYEDPVAYSWDPEATAFFEELKLKAITRDTYYTSIHYIVKPHANTDLTCEIQVRTLFEEAWGEIDHSLNYPNPTTNVACKEQLRVLAKLASTGTRLADSIFKISAAD
jgi:ppGpp synthetase/RelA/SpoT-type nucleotidyltranferase